MEKNLFFRYKTMVIRKDRILGVRRVAQNHPEEFRISFVTLDGDYEYNPIMDRDMSDNEITRICIALNNDVDYLD